MKRFLLAATLLISTFSSQVYAQTYGMTNATFNTCSGTFLDSGAGGNYGNNQTFTMTFCPDVPGSFISFDFTMFNVEANWDQLCVYDGTTVAAPTLGCYDNNVPLLGTVTATNPSGCLTFFFDSDLSVTLPGWIASISCTQPCQTVIADPTFNPAPAVDGIIYLCQGDVLQMNGAGQYPDSGTGYVQSDGTSTFEWSTQDGANQNGQNVTHTFNTEGAYVVQLEITDIEGCDNANDIDQYVYVSTTPIFDGMSSSEDPICLGDQSVLTGGVTPVQFEKLCTVPTFPPLALPDGSGVSYSTSVNLDCYGPGQTLDDINDLLDICVNMEHSYMGDLDIVIECPSGQQVTLVDYPNGGGSTFLGIPVDNDATPAIQGTGFDYCWSPTANNGDWSANAGGFGSTLPAGTYESTNPLSDLVGCDMNGDWSIIITDNLGSDNGFIFNWGINFDPSILPPAVTFTPTIVSDGWQPDPSIVGGTNPITVEPTATGPACYTYEVTDDFGCTYDTLWCITVNPSPVLDPIANVVGCDSYTLPAITGVDLTGGQAYFTGPGGTGTQYNPGAVITDATLTLYAYDTMLVAPFCADEVMFTITLDVTDPVLICPGNLTAVCSIAEQPAYATVGAFTAAGGTATDETSLDAASFTLLSEVSDGNSCPEVVTRTYQIADDCGHTVTCVQTITIDDNINPTASNLPPLAVQCLADVPAPNVADVTDEADNCGVPVVAFISDVSNGLTCPETITRTYSVTDACGNSITVFQQITINDTQVPTASNLGAVNYECIGDVPPPNVLDITDEADNCGVPTVAFLSDVSNGQTCPETIIRSYTITDDCGNSITRTQTIIINDVTNPTASNPAPINVECAGDVPAPDVTVVTDEADNCPLPIVVAHVSDVSNGNTCPEVITRTYSVTDACGNSINVTQTITIDDVTNPTASNPAPIAVACAADVPAPDVTVVTDEADNCPLPIVVAHVSDVSDGNTCPEVITRTYSVTDACGNSINVTQTITVDDNVNPTASNLPPVAVQCLADVPPVNIADVFDEADNCTAAPVVAHISDVSNGLTCPETITRTYSVTDDCGNSITVFQQITINDTQAPTASNLGAVNYQCAADVPAPNILDITDEADNCGPPTVAFLSDVSNGLTCPETIIRSYTITDDCGNSITRTQTIIINDTQAPVLDPAPADVTVECTGDIPAMPNLAWTDNCDGAGTVAGVDVSDGNTCPEVITRTWTYTDACGNTATATQVITIDDTTPPTATNPPDINIPGGPAPAPDINNVTDEADNCGVPVVALVSNVSDGNSCPETITHTFSVTDECGNSITVTQLVIIGDPFPPTGTAPADITVECIGDVPAADPLLITDEADNNGVPVVTHNGDVSDGNTCPEIITRTYDITDACGNVTQVTQTITVIDTQAPVFAAAPANVTVECIGDVPAMTNLGYTDNCDPAGNVAGADVSDGNTCPEIITRTWTYTDACGNNATATQTITVIDTQAPVFAAAPANVTVECIGDVPAMTNLGYTDNCDPAGNVAGVDVSDGNTCPEVITRTWTFTDACGNNATATQTITVIDTQAPVFAAAPADITVECPGDVPPMTNLGYTDNCDPAGSVPGVDGAQVGGDCGGTITRTWTYTDACGNVATATQVITIDDTTPPTASNPPNLNLAGGPAPAPDVTVVTDEADNCGVPVVALVSNVSDGGNCPETVTHTYSVTDACGNTINVTHTIIIGDAILPTASNPAPINVECITAVPAPDPLVVTDEADNGGPPVVAFVSDVSDGNSCPEVITRTYSVTDNCGNVINVTQTITVDDITPPTASAPAPLAVECIADVPAADPLDVIDEADNCGTPTVLFVGDVSDGNTCPEVITRTYSITDSCGNSITVDQIITVDDVTAPVFAAPPANVAVECSADVPAMTNLAYTDNCDAPGNVVGVDVSDGNTCPEVITRTWTFTDACGNVATETQTITVDDITAPVFAAPPANVTVECTADIPAMVNLAYTDNCDAPGDVVGVDVSDGNTCPEVITRTWTFTDACGNVATETQTITIDDTTPPTASNAAQTIVPGGPAPAPDPAVIIDEADNCGVPVVAFVSQVSDGNPCPETITYTYSVTDACGNTINVTHEVLLTDPIAPTGTAPADITVDCITAVPAPDPALIVDEADNNGLPTVTHESDVSDGNTCPEVITRTYRITDPCGNFIDVTQLITVHDLTPPTASAPAPIAVECIGDVPAADPLVVTDEADNCGTPTVAFVGDASDGNTCPETITRTYSITDSCGNSITVDQIITVDDITPPTGTAPANITVECAADVPAADPLLITDEADNCSAPVVAFVGDASDGNTCPEVITRTYSITDACGNVTNVVQTITVDDTTPPTASNAAQTIIPGGPAPAPDPTVIIDEADNCGVPVVAFVSQVSDNNPCPESIIYTYSVTDACGNTINVTHEVLITDPILPTGTAPADVTVDCISAVPAPDPTLIVDEADNNGVPVVTHESDVSDGNSCPEVITRTYRITDACGNFIDVTQLITVHDLTPPTASAPLAVNVECIGDVPAADPLVVTDEADNCGTPTVAFVGDVSDGNTCPEVITRTYSITDSCGNSITVDQIITVDDITPPTASNPVAVNVECIGDVPAIDVTVVTDEADNCPLPIVVAHVSDVSDGNTCPEVITRTYSVTDACGNSINVTQTITVDDVTPPTASNPADINQAGGAAPAPDVTVVIDEADNCTAAPVVAFVSDVSDNNPCPETIVRTYSVTDDCGNQILVTQNIIITDPINPTGTAPAAVNVECIGQVPAPDPLLITDEADNNGVPVVAFVGDVSDGNTCPETITRTYSITDQCGNQILVDQIITVNDITPPTASNPVAVAVECIGDVPAPDVTVVTDEADNCTAAPAVAFVSDVSDGNTCPEVITRTYSVTDDCGNTINVTQTITVDDITPPTASNPVAVNVECIGDVPVPDITVVTDEADNCPAPIVVAHVSDVSDGNTCPEVITRTYSVTDACGNTINVTQTITINDVTPPTASNLPGVTVDIQPNVPPANIADVFDEADNCTAAPVVAFVSDVSDGNTCPELITRTYSVTDDCGNQILVTQIITVTDTQDPTASNPIPVNVECIGDVPAPDVLVVTDEADNQVNPPVVAFVSDVSDGNTCPEIITRTYSVTDDCGNQILVTQTITVDDITPPTASNAIATNVECIGDVPAVDPAVITDEADNCTVAPVVALVSEVSDGNTCPEVITRTYSVTDDCGNSINVTHTITVNDITNPTASNPAPVVVQCIGDVPAIDVTVVTDEADNCTAAPLVAHVSDVSDGNTCPEVITRTYSVTDDCGNSINVTQTITVDDTTLPTASNLPAVLVECIADVPAPSILDVTDEADNCTAAPVVAYVSDVSDGNTCPEVITRTYSVTDDCGNSINVTQTITVNDITLPTASNPADIVVSCASDVPAPNVADVIDEADNCTAAPVVVHEGDVSDGNVCAGEVITRTYSVTDDCGNQITVSHTITISALMPPVSAGLDQEICEGFSVTLIAENPLGAAISWDQGVVDGVAFNPPVGNNTYTVTADICSGECVATDQVDVLVHPTPTVAFTGDDLYGCEPHTVNFTNQSTDQFDCVWDFGDGNVLNDCGPVSNTYLTAGLYDVTLTVTSDQGCVGTDTYVDYVDVVPYPEALFTYDPTGNIDILDTEVDFTNNSLYADSYEWNFGDFSANSFDVDPTHTFPDDAGGTYVVTLLAISNAGCADTATAVITIDDVILFYVPNVFTPDGNSINNTFLPVITAGIDIYDYHLTIFNRWGEVLYETYNPSAGWDGHYGENGLVQDGVYVWQLEFGETMSDKKHKHRGHVTVLK